jgi:hypothetical protein
MNFADLVELEYIARSEFNDDKLQGKVKEAKKQLAQYANDPRLQKVAGKVTLKQIILIYNGWETVGNWPIAKRSKPSAQVESGLRPIRYTIKQ